MADLCELIAPYFWALIAGRGDFKGFKSFKEIPRIAFKSFEKSLKYCKEKIFVRFWGILKFRKFKAFKRFGKIKKDRMGI